MKFSSKDKTAFSPPASSLPGYQTYVRDDSSRNTPTNVDRSPDSVLSPDKATPRSPTRNDSDGKGNLKHLGPAKFNMPDGTAKEVKTRTRPAEGEQYGHTYNDQTTNVRVKRDLRTALISRVATRWLLGAIRVRQRKHVRNEGLYNTRYRPDRPKSQQNSRTQKEKLEARRKYRRKKKQKQRESRIRWRRRYKDNRRFEKVKKRRQESPDKFKRKSPNRSLSERTRKKHQQNYQKRKAMIERITTRWLGEK